MSLVCLSLKDRLMSHAGIGNVQTRVYSKDSAPEPFCLNGTLGVAMPTVKVFDYPLPEDATVIMFSDGISGHFSRDELARFLSLRPQVLAKRLLGNYGKDTDDATIIVGKLS